MPRTKIDRTGETRTMNCGLKATVIEYNREKDITVQFETGEIIKHRQYNGFKKGTILPSNYNHNQTHINKFTKKRIGETRTMNCGLKATIIEYNNTTDITVQFETGEIVQHKRYGAFERKQIAPHNYDPKKELMKQQAKERIGETRTMNCGLKATIIKYRKYNDIDIQFQTGEIIQHNSYQNFIKGGIAPYNYNPGKEQLKQYVQKRIGKTRTMNCGLKATIIEYHNSHNITVQFETGEIVQHKIYNAFKDRKITPYNYNPGKEQLKQYAQKRIGETRTMKCGLKATIIEYNRANDIDIQFETGEIVQHKRYNMFQKGKIIPNKIINNISIEQFVTIKNNKWYYVCKHPQWDKPRILSVPEIYEYNITKDKTIIK